MTSSLSERARTARALAGRALRSGELSRLDALVATAARTLSVASSSLSMLSDRQVVVSTYGVEALDVPRGIELPFEDTLCTNVARADAAVAIDDTHTDERVSSVPVVRSGAIGSYLGSPLRLDGAVVGVLCVMDPAARHWEADDVHTLDTIAGQALDTLLELADGCPDDAL